MTDRGRKGMKTVQGTGRSYQLVQKTKRKDIDGVIYLVAGEKDLWVKLLKDKSAEKEREVRSQITNGYGTFFDIPLDIVTDSGGFIGYTFKGDEMDVVQPKAETVPASKKQKRKTEKKQSTAASVFNDSYIEEPMKKNRIFDSAGNSMITIIGLLVWGLLLFSLNYFWLDSIIWEKFSGNMNEQHMQGCVAFSMHGIIPGIIGAALIFKIMKKMLNKSVSVMMAVILETGIYLASVLFSDILIGMIVGIIIAVVGTVQEYMGTIVVIIVCILILKEIVRK